MANVFIERLWRSIECECIDLHAFETDSGTGIRARWQRGGGLRRRSPFVLNGTL